MIDVTINGELFHPNKLTPGIKIEKQEIQLQQWMALLM